ncbi:UNVERIFIED_CONTAM: hypothetical protein Slati_3123100 [Sesamum latifolium]|uniref:Uncharacterized protein n=1 Tax=Sesamum latifolium TaxID=2727402 RepID=A0AAW2UVG9_9LAMI
MSSHSAIGAEVFGCFRTVHEPAESSAKDGQGVVHAETEAIHHKSGEELGEDVQSADSNSLGSHVPEMGLLGAEDIDMSEDDAVNPSLQVVDGGNRSVSCIPVQLPSDLREQEAALVSVPVRFAAGMRGTMARRGRGRCRAAQRGSVFCKRGREAVVFEAGEGAFRSVKRCHLVDEESDVLSGEAAEQPRHSPCNLSFGTVRGWDPLGQFEY